MYVAIVGGSRDHRPMRRALIFVAFGLLACSVDEELGPGECRTQDDCVAFCTGCRSGQCQVGGIYGDCVNHTGACGPELDATCLESPDGFGICSKACFEDEDCWWRHPDGYSASCEITGTASFCVIPCVDFDCPHPTECFSGICAFAGYAEERTEAEGMCVGAFDPGVGGGAGGGGGGGGAGDEGGGAGGGGTSCCRTCATGKPCGDSCISAQDECHQPPGCAC